MAPKSTPGPSGTSDAEQGVEDGTLGRTRSDRPGVVGRADFESVFVDTFGEEMYEEWLDLMERARVAIATSERNQRLFSGIDVMILDRDTDNLEAILRAIHDALDGGGEIDVQLVLELRDMLLMSLEIVEYDNGALMAILIMGALTTFMLLFKNVDVRAKALKVQLEELQKLLEKARREHTEAKIQTALNGLITIGTALMGPISILTRGAIFVGQQLLDDALGTDPSAAVDKGSKAIDAVGELGEALDQYDDISKGTKSAASGAGKIGTAAGVVFDLNEIKNAGAKVEFMEAKVAEVNRSIKDVREFALRMKPGLQRFAVQRAQYLKRSQIQRRKFEDLRNDLYYLQRAQGI